MEPDADAVSDGEVVHVEPDHGARPRSSPLIRRSRRGRGRRWAGLQPEPPPAARMGVDTAQGAAEADRGGAGDGGGGGSSERHVGPALAST